MITGQAFIIDLLEKLEGHMNLLQTNTDGIFIEPYEGEDQICRDIVNEWVKRTGFEVEFEEGTKLYQKDVNNYCCILNGDEIVAKGSYVNLWNMQDDNKFFEFKLTYNQSQGTIVDKALIKHFLFNEDIEDTINNEMNPRSFMYTLKKGARTYSHVELHENPEDVDNLVSNIAHKISNTNRVFASKDSVVRRITKVKNGKPNKYPNLDINVFVFNKALSEFSEKEMAMIDREYYIRRAKEKLDDYMTISPKKEKKIKIPQVRLRVYSSETEVVEEKKVKLPELTNEQLRECVINHTDGEFRLGDCTIHRIGSWFTFIEKKGKTTILNVDKILDTTFKVTLGKLRKIKIKVDNKSHLEVFERTLDTEVIYIHKKELDECFDFITKTFEEAIETLRDSDLLEVEEAAEILSNNVREAVITTGSGKDRENILLDENNQIVYKGKDRGAGMVYEIFWLKEGKTYKHEKVGDKASVMIFVEKWIIEYNEDLKLSID
jgi:hypothetical protein